MSGGRSGAGLTPSLRPCILAGNNTKIATIGGSITSGQGSSDAPNWPQVDLDLDLVYNLDLDILRIVLRRSQLWPQWLQNYLEDNYGEDVVQGVKSVDMVH